MISIDKSKDCLLDCFDEQLYCRAALF